MQEVRGGSIPGRGTTDFCTLILFVYIYIYEKGDRYKQVCRSAALLTLSSLKLVVKFYFISLQTLMSRKGIPTRSDKNRSVQSQERARILKF